MLNACCKGGEKNLIAHQFSKLTLLQTHIRTVNTTVHWINKKKTEKAMQKHRIERKKSLSGEKSLDFADFERAIEFEITKVVRLKSKNKNL